MPTQLASVNERSAAFPSFTFRDEAGALVVPVTAVWSLLDGQGNIVNNRDNVAVSPLASSVTITVYGDDLVCAGGRDVDRYLLVEATYNSSDGVKPLNDDAHFRVIHLNGL